MSPSAIWPPHSSEQIFEARIRTPCHAYVNEEARRLPAESSNRLQMKVGAHVCVPGCLFAHVCAQEHMYMCVHAYASCIRVFVSLPVCGKQKDIPLSGGDLSQHTHA